MTRHFPALLVCALVLSLAAGQAAAGSPALMRVERTQAVTRNQLIDQGLSLVAEYSGCFLAVGDAAEVTHQAEALGLKATVLDERVEGHRYAVLSLRSTWSEAELDACAESLWFEESWVLVRTLDLNPPCLQSPGWFRHSLDLKPLGRTRPAPAEFAGGEALVVKPLVQQMVNDITDSQIQIHWAGIVNSATRRCSDDPGCVTAADLVYDTLAGYGLTTTYQNYHSGWAPNVVATLPGVTTPDQVYIVIGHLDDINGYSCSTSQPAPGADDNASGSATVTALAEIMSGYRFASTVKFITVTGEEQGLYGSTYYADQAQGSGENIQAVLDGDMTAWEGDSASEDLDVTYDSGSAWLGTLITQAAADYATGCPIHACLCSENQYSDHYPFWADGYSAICAITDHENICYSCGATGEYPYYHTPNDTMANCGDLTFFYSTVRANLATLAHMADPLCQLPSAPASLTATPNGANRIDLSWPSAGAGLTYQVWRAPGGCSAPGAWTMVGETASLAYADITVSGGITYAYVVKSRDATGYCVSDAGPCDEAVTTGSCLEPPGFAGLATVTDDHLSTCTLTLGWAAATSYCGGSLSYNVYRSTTPGFVPGISNRIAFGLTGLSYLDSVDLISGTTYYYVVRAVDSANGVEDANLVEVSNHPTGPFTNGTWTDDAGDTDTAKLVPTSPWSVGTTGGHTAAKVYKTGTYPANTCAAATSPTMHLGTSAQLSFWSHYDIENDWDKGLVQISTNGGSTWSRVTVNYPGSANNTSDACNLGTGAFFSGTGSSYAQYTGSLSTWNNLDVKVRWVLSSDGYVEQTGWWVDDIAITNVQVPGTCETQGGSATADLGVALTDGSCFALPAGAVTYTLTVTNAGPDAVTGATVSDPVSGFLTGATWTCSATGGGSCTASGSGNVSDTVNLPSGATLTYSISGTVSAASGLLVNTATVTPPATASDPVPGNNTASDTDFLQTPLFCDDFESGDTSGWTSAVPLP